MNNESKIIRIKVVKLATKIKLKKYILIYSYRLKSQY